MVVVAVIGILAALILPVVGKVKHKAQATKCLNNLRQLQMGWGMYISDHGDTLPPNSDGWDAGKDADHPSWVAGNLRTEFEAGDKSDGTDETLLIGDQYAAFGSIGIYLRSAAVYRCPGDRSGRARTMSMNSYMNGTGLWQDSNYVTFVRFGEIRNPENTWVFIDEREDSINEGSFAVDMAAQYGIIDYPASYHNGSGTLSFADGHAERHSWREATTSPVLRRGYHLTGGRKFTSADDRDMMWLTERTTVLR